MVTSLSIITVLINLYFVISFCAMAVSMLWVRQNI